MGQGSIQHCTIMASLCSLVAITQCSPLTVGYTYSSATLQQAVEMEQESGGRQGKRRLSENEDDGEMEVEGVGHEDTPISKRQKEDQPQPSSASAGELQL